MNHCECNAIAAKTAPVTTARWLLAREVYNRTTGERRFHDKERTFHLDITHDYKSYNELIGEAYSFLMCLTKDIINWKD